MDASVSVDKLKDSDLTTIIAAVFKKKSDLLDGEDQLTRLYNELENIGATWDVIGNLKPSALQNFISIDAYRRKKAWIKWDSGQGKTIIILCLVFLLRHEQPNLPIKIVTLNH